MGREPVGMAGRVPQDRRMNTARVVELLRELADELEGAAPPAAESSTQPVAPERWNPKRVQARVKAGKIDDVNRQWAKQLCRRKGIPLRSDTP